MSPSLSLLDYPVETVLFGESLSCDVELAVDFRTDTAASASQQQAVALLHAVAVVEDMRAEQKDDRPELQQPLQRLEAKMDLMLGVLGRLLRNAGDALPIRPLRWSYKGMRLNLADVSGPVAGSRGVLLIQPAPWLEDRIELPAHVLETARDGDTWWVWLAFDGLSPALTEALERHLFRLHRRQIAGQRLHGGRPAA